VADSPVLKLLPKLEAEDRSRFIVVPEEFREEVERARRHERPEHLRLLAVECEGFLWEVEGLREVGRAQFESNFIDGAKVTWKEIANRYPDDVEANTVLSTIYQRVNDITRSEQALARVSRIGSLSAQRLSQLRSLSGRNLKEAWSKQWRDTTHIPEREKNVRVCEFLMRLGELVHANSERMEQRAKALSAVGLFRDCDAQILSEVAHDNAKICDVLGELADVVIESDSLLDGRTNTPLQGLLERLSQHPHWRH